ncbi:hypothetical protein [Brevibacillus borstelensis]|uniref:hypothetical protein n=1 Tax=Brevibacillus borstelensis TaxID=45462 RepID=UPI0030BA2F64
MNCQEFRKAWEDTTNESTLFHIETCEECMVWIEAQFANGEEVQFLKEVPQPSAQLEDKIMQAIYETTGQGFTPQAASVQAVPAPAVKPARRFRPKLSSLTWAGAAAILLVVGAVGYLQSQNAGQEISMESVFGGENSQGTIASAPAENRPASVAMDAANNQAIGKASTESGQAAPPASKASSAPETTGQSAKQADALNRGTFGNQLAMDVPAEKNSELKSAKEAAKPNAAAPDHKRPMIAARNANGKPAAEQPKAPAPVEAPLALADQNNSIASVPAEEEQNKALSNQPVNALAMDANADAAEQPAMEQTPALVGPAVSAMAKAEITMSTFSDVETAAHASDMPVPQTGQLPEGFSLHAISAQYESQTSQKVVRLTSEYKHNKDWIKVEVVRNENGKRSLSIPGTFTATQLFTIQSEQAIAVSFEKQADAGETAPQHAVHFNAQPDNQSLYVVVTAKGVTLDQLVEASKQITWQ